MAYVVVMGSFPSHVGKEVGKTFLKLEKLPDFVKTEHVFNTASLAERRAKDRQFGKYVKSVLKGKNKLTGQ